MSKSRKPQAPDNPDYNEVKLREVKPNPLFPAWMTERIRRLTFARSVPCACCGRRSKHHWTMLMNFRAAILGRHPFRLDPEAAVHPPFTPVCSSHPLEPCMPFKSQMRENKKGKS